MYAIIFAQLELRSLMENYKPKSSDFPGLVCLRPRLSPSRIYTGDKLPTDANSSFFSSPT
jgi:hypothetical protein